MEHGQIQMKPLKEKQRTANSTFAIGGVSCSADSFVVKGSLVLRINICGKKPAHRKSAKRYGGVHSQLLFPHLSLTYVLLVLIVAFILN